MGFTRVLGGILLFALLHNPGQVLGVVVPPGQSVTLAWNRNPNPNVAGYYLYYGGASGIYTNKTSVGNATNATIASLIPGTTYYFAATAYFSSGVESPFSSEVAYTVQIYPLVRFRITPTRQFIMTVIGPVGHTYVIQATQNLTTWTDIGTVTVGASGSLDFTDTNAASFSKRFYRTRG